MSPKILAPIAIALSLFLAACGNAPESATTPAAEPAMPSDTAPGTETPPVAEPAAPSS